MAVHRSSLMPGWKATVGVTVEASFNGAGYTITNIFLYAMTLLYRPYFLEDQVVRMLQQGNNFAAPSFFAGFGLVNCF